jgi:spermidine/putrescine transport system permease protein
MLLIVVAPLGIVVAVALSTKGAYGGFEFRLSFDAFRSLLFSRGWTDELEFNPQYLIIIARSVLLALATAIICLLISFPVAYTIARQAGRRKTLLIYLVTLPFWVSQIVRIYAWVIIFSRNGPLDAAAQAAGIRSGAEGFLYTNGAMVIGMVYSYVPLMVLPVYAAIEKLDPALIEASHDLYASRWRTLRRVILPLTRPGMIAGFILVCVPSLGSILEPVLLGGGKKMMMGNLIMNQFGIDRNWPLGAAVAIVLLSMIMIVLMADGLKKARASGNGSS